MNKVYIIGWFGLPMAFHALPTPYLVPPCPCEVGHGQGMGGAREGQAAPIIYFLCNV